MFGNLLQMDFTRVHQQVEGRCQTYASVFKLRFGKRRVVVICDHELINSLLRDRPDGFRRTERMEQLGRVG